MIHGAMTSSWLGFSMKTRSLHVIIVAYVLASITGLILAAVFGPMLYAKLLSRSIEGDRVYMNRTAQGGITMAEIDAEMGHPGDDVSFADLPQDLQKNWATGGQDGSYRKWVFTSEDAGITETIYVEFKEGKSGKPYSVIIARAR
jgi:hypothetical protein